MNAEKWALDAELFSWTDDNDTAITIRDPFCFSHY